MGYQCAVESARIENCFGRSSEKRRNGKHLLVPNESDQTERAQQQWDDDPVEWLLVDPSPKTTVKVTKLGISPLAQVDKLV
jgi:hypothetical protein